MIDPRAFEPLARTDRAGDGAPRPQLIRGGVPLHPRRERSPRVDSRPTHHRFSLAFDSQHRPPRGDPPSAA